MLGEEIDLLKNYPKSSRNLNARAAQKTVEDRAIARQFGRDFFDGDRRHGYGGFNYHPRFWQPVIPDLQQHFQLNSGSRVLDVGCAKGFMLYDMQQLIPGIQVTGVDISDYALKHAKPQLKPFLQQADAKDLPFENHSFDTVISINTLHNLPEKECGIALQEIMRVSCGKAFITLDAYRNDEEKQRMLDWALTAQTIMHVDDWKSFFLDYGYSGDFYWFMP